MSNLDNDKGLTPVGDTPTPPVKAQRPVTLPAKSALPRLPFENHILTGGSPDIRLSTNAYKNPNITTVKSDVIVSLLCMHFNGGR